MAEDDALTRRDALRVSAGVAGLLALTAVAGCSADPAKPNTPSTPAFTDADVVADSAVPAASSGSTAPPSASARASRSATSAAPSHPKSKPASSEPGRTATSEPQHPTSTAHSSSAKPPPSTSRPPSSSKPPPPPKPPANAIAKLSDIPVRGSVAATANKQPVLLAQPAAGRVVGFSAICTHQGCTVAPGGARLNCPCHGSVYNAFTGAVIQGPAPKSLPRFGVRVVDGYVVPD